MLLSLFSIRRPSCTSSSADTVVPGVCSVSNVFKLTFYENVFDNEVHSTLYRDFGSNRKWQILN